MTSDVGCVSAVIASLVGPRFIDDCLTSLEQQAKDVKRRGYCNL
jgi:hypothetical protein